MLGLTVRRSGAKWPYLDIATAVYYIKLADLALEFSSVEKEEKIAKLTA